MFLFNLVWFIPGDIMIPFIDILDRIGKKAYRIFLYWIQDILRQLVKHFKKSQNRKENKSPKSKY